MVEQLPIYEVLARNTSADSENKIHDDAVAAGFGFSGGLVPGVTVFGYLTVPVVDRFPEWLEHGSMRVRFEQPFYEGDAVTIRAIARTDEKGIAIDLRAEGRDGAACATGSAIVSPQTEPGTRPRISHYETR